jgi:hypothetical protein
VRLNFNECLNMIYGKPPSLGQGEGPPTQTVDFTGNLIPPQMGCIESAPSVVPFRWACDAGNIGFPSWT